MSKLLLIYLILLNRKVFSQIFCYESCFLKCEDEENNDCLTENCKNSLGRIDEISNFSYIATLCNNDEDLCTYREIELNLNNEIFRTSLPSGCLLDLISYPNEDYSIFHFANNVDLFTCVGNSCNQPNLETCRLDEAVLRGVHNQLDIEDKCTFTSTDDINTILNTNVVRKDINFCVNDGFRQFLSNSECFLTEQPCLLEDLVELDVITCSQCGDDINCDINLPVQEQPTQTPSFSPTKKPTTSPTFAPTKKPTVSPTTKPSVPTISPTQKPTKTPSTQPTFKPIEQIEEAVNVTDNDESPIWFFWLVLLFGLFILSSLLVVIIKYNPIFQANAEADIDLVGLELNV